MKQIKMSFAALAGASILLSSCGGQGQGQMQMSATPYKTMVVATGERSIEQSYSATIRGRQDIDIYPQVSGTLMRLNVNEGDIVRKGQSLFVIDQVPYQAALSQASANVKAAQASLASSRLSYEAKQRLRAENIISEIELQTALNSLHSAEATLAQARALETNARQNLFYTTVVSPADGVVGTLPYRQGALVSAQMSQPLTTVSDNSEMYVYFSIDEKQLLNMTRQYGSMEAALKAIGPVSLELSDGSRYAHTGVVESISGVIDRTTGATSLRAKFPNPERLLRSGSSGKIILTHHYKDVIVVPQAATVQMQDKHLVYKVVDGVATSAVISVVPISNGQEFLVSGGLNAGETIIAEGAGLVREGTAVATETSQAQDKSTQSK